MCDLHATREQEDDAENKPADGGNPGAHVSRATYETPTAVPGIPPAPCATSRSRARRPATPVRETPAALAASRAARVSAGRKNRVGSRGFRQLVEDSLKIFHGLETPDDRLGPRAVSVQSPHEKRRRTLQLEQAVFTKVTGNELANVALLQADREFTAVDRGVRRNQIVQETRRLVADRHQEIQRVEEFSLPVHAA